MATVVRERRFRAACPWTACSRTRTLARKTTRFRKTDVSTTALANVAYPRGCGPAANPIFAIVQITYPYGFVTINARIREDGASTRETRTHRPKCSTARIHTKTRSVRSRISHASAADFSTFQPRTNVIFSISTNIRCP